MPSSSLEGRGCFEAQGLRKPQTGLHLDSYRSQQLLRAHHSATDSSRQVYTGAPAGRAFGTLGRQYLRCQRAQCSFSGHSGCTCLAKHRAELWLSPLASGRRSKVSRIIEARRYAPCLRTSDQATVASPRQRYSTQMSSRQKLLRLLIVVRAAQTQSSSRDASCSQQLEASLANKDSKNAHLAFMELQKAGQNGRPNAEVCNGLLQRELPT